MPAPNDLPKIEDICSRMEESIKKDLNMSLSRVSATLGYSNQSPLTRISKGKGFVGPDRLAKFATLTTKDGGTPNINWILTGVGPRTIVNSELDVKAKQIIQLLGEEKLKQLLIILGSAEISR